MKTAVGDGGMAIICRFKGLIFTIKTVYHREQELMAEVIDPKTRMLMVRPNAQSEAEELRTQITPRLSILLSRLSTIEQDVCRLFRKGIWVQIKFWIFENLFCFENLVFVSKYID